MLGVGLHSYGFMEKALPWLVAFVISQLMIASLALLPERFWWSFHASTTDAATRMVKHSNREQVSPI
jgi:hypothetical protein